MGDDPEGIDPTAPAAEILAAAVAGVVRGRFPARRARPFVIGIAGGVAMGKSTLANGLARYLGGSVEILSTDSFLLPNGELEARGLVLRKGFPESYDVARAERTLAALRCGRSVTVPVYSHETYDIVDGAARTIAEPDVLVLEGVNALRFRAFLDFGIYLDAPVEAVEEWYVTRLVALVAEATPGSFYDGWTGLAASELDTIARRIFRSVNLVNLRECVEPTRAHADLVVEKGPSHELRVLRSTPHDPRT